jgi:predicted AAA+ superfamily ATPase
MVRQIQPWAGNTQKRLVKSPKIYLRDTGLLHNLLNISDFESLLSHPVVGSSWEGFVIENTVAALSNKWRYSYYRTTGQTEIDLILEGPNNQVWAVEIKRSSAPTLSKGFYSASEDIKATHRFVVYSGTERFPMSANTEAIGLIEFLKMLEEKNNTSSEFN